MKIPAFGISRQKKPKSSERKSKFRIQPLSRWHPGVRQLFSWIVTASSVLLCLLLLPTRLPGMELLGIGPNWLLIWVVTWSVKRTVFAGALAGIVLGLLQDSMTAPNPSHAISLGIVGILTGLLQKQRFIEEDFISIAVIVFVMAVLAETIFGLQLTLIGNERKVTDIWTYYQRVALASAILSSLWAPVVYYPLNRWWQRLKLLEQ
ncbi:MULTISPECIES: rod shape-determining protein MreD [unclassified Nostoc]|uniref:rod shape-determining protein MreD n=1 Tax=unclassified Nostoc TaxID=2593658 RepID=UPI0015C356D5|nr:MULTISPECIES: rod shape-determining protein MreD [unclassified Nostoc]MBD2509752.1 rod shape-determining protein MreD [Desmonostoc muscorum FACHB-395]MBE8988536.1 rod shape-determining protein MreD [Nostoc sp. LEGE 12450]QLE48052.1 rod shape-determining protein MreD [Nostoc sp. C057]